MIPTLERTSVEEAVRLAREMTAERLRASPRSPLFAHADEQLRIIQGFVVRNEMPTLEDVESIDIGLMAVKELEADDPDYAKALMKAAGRFESLLDDL
jgi:Tsi6